jgi:hypothetical protein
MDRFAFLQCLPYLHKCPGKRWPPKVSSRSNAGTEEDALISIPVLWSSSIDRHFVVSIEPTVDIDNGNAPTSTGARSIGPIGFGVDASPEVSTIDKSSQSQSSLDPCLCRFEAVLTNVHPLEAGEMGLMSAASPSGSSTTTTTTTTHISGSQSHSQSSPAMQGNTTTGTRRSLLSSLLSTTPKAAPTPAQAQPTPRPYSSSTPRQRRSLTPVSQPHLFFRFDDKFTSFVDYSQLISASVEEGDSDGPLPASLLLHFEGCCFRVFCQNSVDAGEPSTTTSTTPTATNSLHHDGSASSLMVIKDVLTQWLVEMPCPTPDNLQQLEVEDQGETSGEGSDPSSHQPGQREDSGFDQEDSLNDYGVTATQAMDVVGATKFPPPLSNTDQDGDDNDEPKAQDSQDQSPKGKDDEQLVRHEERKTLLEGEMKTTFIAEEHDASSFATSEDIVDAAEQIVRPLYRKRKLGLDQGWHAIESVISSEPDSDAILKASFISMESAFSQAMADSAIKQEESQLDLQNCDGACEKLDSELNECLEVLFPGPRSRGTRATAFSGRSSPSPTSANKIDNSSETILHLIQKQRVATAARHLIAIEGCGKI